MPMQTPPNIPNKSTSQQTPPMQTHENQFM
jgi:hypothetical protein